MLIIITELNYYTLLMAKILDKFIQNIKNLENYYILREDSKHLIVTTNITIKKFHENLNNVFQPYNANVDVNLNVIFIIPLMEEFPEKEEYKKRNIPFLVLPKKILFDKDENFKIKECLDEFVETKIKI
jgi:hypothetical protein